MAQINPYINFNGNCLEAMNFYKEGFGGNLDVLLVKDTPVAEQCPAGMQEQVMHSTLVKNGFILMASDMVRPEGFEQGNNFSVSVNCYDQGEINHLYGYLSEGGKVIDSLKQQFWGAWFAVVVDKFNTPWILNYDPKHVANFPQQ